MTIHAFVGPSLKISDRSQFPGVVWHAPAARNDLSKLDAEAGDSVLLIDGVMFTGYSPSPTECARVMGSGLNLTGCSSIGALRAVELATMGMRGSGWVFQQVLARTITYDDELLARLNPLTLQAETIFIVNVRFALTEAIRQGTVNPGQATAALRQLGRIHFLQRSNTRVREILCGSGIDPVVSDELLGTRFDIKRSDALEALTALASGGK